MSEHNKRDARTLLGKVEGSQPEQSARVGTVVINPGAGIDEVIAAVKVKGGILVVCTEEYSLAKDPNIGAGCEYPHCSYKAHIGLNRFCIDNSRTKHEFQGKLFKFDYHESTNRWHDCLRPDTWKKK